MSEFRPSNDAPPPGTAARFNSIREGMLLGLVLFTLVRSSEALADEQATMAAGPLDAVGNSRQPSPSATPIISGPGLFTMPPAADVHVFSTTDFRPRKRTVFDSDPGANTVGDAPMLTGTTVWQRMAEYKSQDRVRLLTLWESRGSTVSVQAGKRGDPSLQWTSRVMNRDGSTRGLLDRLFSVSFVGAGTSSRNPARSTSAPAAPKAAGNPVVPSLK